MTIMLSILGIDLASESVAAEKMFLISPEHYEDESGTGFQISDDQKVSSFSYGAEAFCSMRQRRDSVTNVTGAVNLFCGAGLRCHAWT